MPYSRAGSRFPGSSRRPERENELSAEPAFPCERYILLTLRRRAIAALAVAALAMGGLVTTPSSAASGFIGVILPESSETGRWEAFDRPYLNAALKAAGVSYDIESADGDINNFQNIADQMLSRGAKVLILAGIDSPTTRAVQERAKKYGVPTIDYDRITSKGSAAYFVAFDNIAIGRSIGQGIKSCLNRARKKTARIAYLNGPSGDSNAVLYKQGYDSILGPLVRSKAYTLVDDTAVPSWDPSSAGIIFEQQLSKSGGELDAVVAPNDAFGLAIINILKKNKLNGKICVSGQDATVDGLRATLAGDLTITVYKPIRTQANAAASLAATLLLGKPVTNATHRTNNDLINVPSVLVAPIGITKERVKLVIADGFQKRADICKGLEALCKQHRI